MKSKKPILPNHEKGLVYYIADLNTAYPVLAFQHSPELDRYFPLVRGNTIFMAIYSDGDFYSHE